MAPHRWTRPLIVSAALAAFPLDARAQCPDGTPPPCRAAAAVTRRAAPSLDERTWIVLPFENVARAPDIDWLRDASVNLLYLDLSRWRDVRVIDDERVADLMREVPAASRERLGLETGLLVARRVGAGKLVMGDLLKLGTRTAVVAKVFDVRTGQRLRSVREEAASADSLMPAFSRLARGILNVPTQAGADLGTVGTTSLEAYRTYLDGLRALNAWEIPAALRYFEAALRIDSGFALAHYKLSVAYGWSDPGAAPRRMHAEAAARLARSLPARERSLIAGQAAMTGERWGEACVIHTSLVRADSSDVEAWYNLGDCSFHDPMVEPAPDDTSRLVFRSSWNAALRAFTRALELDPTYHLAFAHIHDILQADQRGGCRAERLSGCALFHVAVPLRQDDTIVTGPIPVTDMGEIRAQVSSEARIRTRRVHLALGRDLAARWVAAGPTEARANIAYGRALLRTGDAAGAARVLRTVTPSGLSPFERPQWLVDRLDAALKLEGFGEALGLLDTVAATFTGAERLAAGVLFTMFGRIARGMEFLPDTSAITRYVRAVVLLGVGVLPDSLERTEREFQAAIAATAPAGQRAAARRRLLLGSTLLGFRYRRTGPALEWAQDDPRIRMLAAVAAGDPETARRAIASYDSSIMGRPPELGEAEPFLWAAEAHLAVGDSATALERLRQLEERWPYAILARSLDVDVGLPAGVVWGRAWLLTGDLAAALGAREDAVRGYRRVARMWSGSDPELQPAVARARAALERLGAS